MFNTEGLLEEDRASCDFAPITDSKTWNGVKENIAVAKKKIMCPKPISRHSTSWPFSNENDCLCRQSTQFISPGSTKLGNFLTWYSKFIRFRNGWHREAPGCVELDPSPYLEPDLWWRHLFSLFPRSLATASKHAAGGSPQLTMLERMRHPVFTQYCIISTWLWKLSMKEITLQSSQRHARLRHRKLHMNSIPNLQCYMKEQVTHFHIKSSKWSKSLQVWPAVCTWIFAWRHVLVEVFLQLWWIQKMLAFAWPMCLTAQSFQHLQKHIEPEFRMIFT